MSSWFSPRTIVALPGSLSSARETVSKRPCARRSTTDRQHYSTARGMARYRNGHNAFPLRCCSISPFVPASVPVSDEYEGAPVVRMVPTHIRLQRLHSLLQRLIL